MAFYLLNKKSGITSNSSLNNFKKQLNIKKAGFSGVLDPFATGLLIIATDGDTKFLDVFLKMRKTYSGVILFGKSTDTLDTDGNVLEEKEIKLDIKELKYIIENKFIGKIMQVPPIYSNIKVNGQRAHKLARKNEEFKLNEVEREIYSFDILNILENKVKFKIEVSSGTYIRSIARDIGVLMGIPTMLTKLKREKIGDISVHESDFLEIKRENLLINFEFKNIDINSMKDLLDGKKISINSDSNELIVNDNKNVLWVKRIDDKYKIYKKIE